VPNLCIIPSRALADPELTYTDLRALCAVGRFTSRDGTGVWASNATLATVAGVDERHLRRSLVTLVERGYIRKVPRTLPSGAQTTSMLSVLLDEPAPAIPPHGEGERRPEGRAESAHAGRATAAHQTTPTNDPINDKHLTATAFDAVWGEYPKRAGHNAKAAALKSFLARRAAGVSHDALLEGTRRYAVYIRATQREGTEYVMQGQRFYGSAEPFREPWTLPPAVPVKLDKLEQGRAHLAAWVAESTESPHNTDMVPFHE